MGKTSTSTLHYPGFITTPLAIFLGVINNWVDVKKKSL